MIPLHHDPHFTVRSADDRIIPRFHLEGIEAGRRVSALKIDADSEERLGLLTTATVGDGGPGGPDGADHRPVGGFVYRFARINDVTSA
jgi:hypothetical protein